MNITFDRKFVVYSYGTSHGQLLLRSPKTRENPTRIDVLFRDVRLMELRSNMDRLEIRETALEDVADRATKPVHVVEPGHKAFILTDGASLGLIVAGAVVWKEDDGEFFQPSALLE
jgi:hypothetical protein